MSWRLARFRSPYGFGRPMSISFTKGLHMQTAEKVAGASCELVPGERQGNSIVQHESNRRLRKLTEEQKKLAEEFWPTAKAIADRFSKKYASKQVDFEGAVSLALVSTATNFDPSLNYSFKTLFRRRAVGACQDALRATQLAGLRRRVPVQDQPSVHSFSSLDLNDGVYEGNNTRAVSAAASVPADELPIGWELEWEDDLRHLTKPLKGANGEAMRRLYLNAELSKMKACAKSLGMSESRISQLHSQGIELMQEAIENAKRRERVA